MAKRISLTYYFVSKENDEKLRLFMQVSGDSLKTLVQQYVRGWISRNRELYMDLARYDAQRRNLLLPVWAEIVAEGGMHHLPEVTSNPEYRVINPLANIVRPETNNGAIKHTINYLVLGSQNLVLFRLANYYDQDSTIGFVSRIVQEHLDRNWDKLYQPQVEAENFENWK